MKITKCKFRPKVDNVLFVIFRKHILVTKSLPQPGYENVFLEKHSCQPEAFFIENSNMMNKKKCSVEIRTRYTRVRNLTCLPLHYIETIREFVLHFRLVLKNTMRVFGLVFCFMVPLRTPNQIFSSPKKNK